MCRRTPPAEASAPRQAPPWRSAREYQKGRMPWLKGRRQLTSPYELDRRQLMPGRHRQSTPRRYSRSGAEIYFQAYQNTEFRKRQKYTEYWHKTEKRPERKKG